jgi:membrane protein implicated in regulation of membrane protease activity
VGPAGDLYATHPAWLWAAGAAALLVAELFTGSGWLLWPAASAGVVGLLEVWTDLPGPVAVAVFALLTIVSTASARRLFPRRGEGAGPDINDSAQRLIGARGRTLTRFEARAGRVMVEGKEWSAEADDAAPLDAGASVQVVGVTGARLRVRAV